MVDTQIAHNADPVGILAVHAAIIGKLYGIHRAGACRPWALFVHQTPGVPLEGDGYIQSLAGVGLKVTHRLFQAPPVNMDGAILQTLPGLPCKVGMDLR